VTQKDGRNMRPKRLPKELQPTPGDLFDQLEHRRTLRAARLLGKSDLSRLRWLLRFAESADDLPRLPPEKFVKLSAQIEAFAERAGSLARNQGEDLTIDSAASLAGIVRDGLRAYANGETSPDFPGLDFEHLQLSPVPGSGRSPWRGPWRSLFLIAVGEVLGSEGGRFRFCPARAGFWPCSRLFVKRKRGTYCSTTCSQRERTRRFRADAEAYSRRRHRYYEEQVRRKSKRKERPKIPRRAPLTARNDRFGPVLLKGEPVFQSEVVFESKFFRVLVDARGLRAAEPLPKTRRKRLRYEMPVLMSDPVAALELVNEREIYSVTRSDVRMRVMDARGWENKLAHEQCLKSGFMIQQARVEPAAT